MSKGKTSKSGKSTYAIYRNGGHYAKNKRVKLERHLKKYPEDKTAQACLDKGMEIGFSYKRKTTKSPMWSHTDKHHAEVWASVGHKGTEYLDYIKKQKLGKKIPAVVVKSEGI